MRIAHLTCILGFASLAVPAWSAVDYSAQIQPMWDEHCVDCHSASEAEGDFVIDTAESLFNGGKAGKAIVLGKADESLLVKYLEGRSGKTGKNQFMPPGKRQHLSSESIALVKQWINEGAKVSTAPAADPLVGLPKVAAQSSIRPIHSVAATADGKLAALGRYGSVELIDVASKRSLLTLAGVAGKPTAMAFSSDDRILFVAAGEAGVRGVAYQFSVADGALTRSFSGHSDALHALAISPTTSRLATGGYDQKIKLWDLATGKEITTLKGHNGSINALAFRPDGKVLASASADRTVKLWDVASGARLDTFSQPTKEQFALAFSADGKELIAGGADNRIRLWGISAAAREGSNPILATKFAHEGAVLGLAYSPDGKSLVSTASDRTIKLWDAPTLTERTLLEKQSDWANGVAWAGNEHLIAARQDGSAGVYTAAKPVAGVPLLAAGMPAKSNAKPSPAAGKPVLSSVTPRGFQVGVKTRISADGKGLADCTQVRTSDPRIKATIVTSGARPVIEIESPPGLQRRAYTMALVAPGGETEALSLLADTLTQWQTLPSAPIREAANFWGTLKTIGQQDAYPFRAGAGQTVVLDLAAKQLGSKALTIQLEVLDSTGARLASNRGLDSGTDPFIAFTAPADGIFTARVSETTFDGSAEHIYRLTLGQVPYIMGWWPLEVPANRSSTVQLVGYNLPSPTVQISAGATGSADIPAELAAQRSRMPVSLPISQMAEFEESEPNNNVQNATSLAIPGAMNGRLRSADDAADADCFAIDAKVGESWIVETIAAARNSPADTKIEALNADGSPVEKVKLRAVRDSWNNFRGVDANNPDIRLEFWTEMDLNDYIYFNGDVMRIMRNPRGPDAGFLFYSSNGKRKAWFDTTATGHALDEPAYVVEPLKPGEQAVPNGLPVFSVPYSNDDDGERILGRDSRLTFTAPKDGRYVIRVTDSRGWSGGRFAYRLVVRKPVPDFSVTVEGTANQAVSPGSSMGFSLNAARKDGFSGPITVTVAGLPPGWYASSPIVIQADQNLATGSLHAEPNAMKDADFSRLRVTATAMISGQAMTKGVTSFGKPVLGGKPKFVAHLEPSVNVKPVARTSSTPQEIVMVPGETVSAFIRVDRLNEKGALSFDVHNLPFGVILDNIGLSGVQVRVGEDLREIFFTAAKWVPEQERLIHAAVASTRNEQASDGLVTSYPVLLKIRSPKTVVQQ